MFNIIKFIENVKKFLRIKLKIVYWKLKYGKNIVIGKRLIFEKNFKINMTKNAKLIIGDYNYFNNDCSINCHKKIVIGNNNLFGENVKIYDHSHIFNTKDYNIKKNYYDNQVIIGDKNWICTNAVILNKALIGDGNVIGASVVFNKEIGSNILIKNTNMYEEVNIKRK